MTILASHITSLTVVYSIVYLGVDQRKHQSSASLAFVRGIHRGPVNSPNKWPVTRKMFPFDDVIMWPTRTSNAKLGVFVVVSLNQSFKKRSSCWWFETSSVQWRHNGSGGVSNHQPHYCLFDRLFRHRSKKISKLYVTGLGAGNSPVAGEYTNHHNHHRQHDHYHHHIFNNIIIMIMIMITITFVIISSPSSSWSPSSSLSFIAVINNQSFIIPLRVCGIFHDHQMSSASTIHNFLACRTELEQSIILLLVLTWQYRDPGLSKYSALSIYRGHFSSYNPRKTPHSSPVRARYGVSFVGANLSKFYHFNCCAVCTILSYITAIYGESISVCVGAWACVYLPI